jgi:hypothetical protein
VDRVAIEILKAELLEDAKVLAHASRETSRLLGSEPPGDLRACAYELH